MNREELLTKRVAVIAGGWSDEREISLLSGAECRRALLEAGFTTVDLLDLAADNFVETLMHGGYDVAYVALHGRYGEDGSIQGLLEILHMPYTFSGVTASAAGTEKGISKAVYAAAGIRAPKGVEVEPTRQFSDTELEALVADLGLPIFVKPASNGSSFGVSRVTQAGEVNAAVAAAGAQGDRVLVEECVAGTEISVPVIGNDDAHALPVIEIVTGADFYDIKVKYEPSALHHVIPARLEPGVYAKAQDLAEKAHRALGCRGCSRSDFIVTAAGEPVILETNTIPGMTAESLLPDSARHGGIEFPELCCKFVEYAFEAFEGNN